MSYSKIDTENLQFANFASFTNCCGNNFANSTGDVNKQEQTTENLEKLQYGYGLLGEFLQTGISAREQWLNRNNETLPFDDEMASENNNEPKNYKPYIIGGVVLVALIGTGIYFFIK